MSNGVIVEEMFSRLEELLNGLVNRDQSVPLEDQTTNDLIAKIEG